MVRLKIRIVFLMIIANLCVVNMVCANNYIIQAVKDDDVKNIDKYIDEYGVNKKIEFKELGRNYAVPEMNVKKFSYLVHIATIYKKTDVVKLLLNKGVNPSLIDGNGNTALHYAVYNNSYEIVRLLCNKDNVNLKNKQYDITPFELAVLFEDNYSIIKHMLQNGADPNSIQTAQGYNAIGTPLCYVNSLKTAKLLIKYGANYSYEIKGPNFPKNHNLYGTNTIYTAVSNNKSEIAKYLIEIFPTVDYEIVNPKGDTMIQQALYSGNYDFVSYLLSKHNYKDVKSNNDNIHPFHLVCSGYASNYFKSTYVDTKTDWHELLPEIISKENQSDNESLQKLYEYFRNDDVIHQVNFFGEQPIHYASFLGTTEIIKLLLHENIDINSQIRIDKDMSKIQGDPPLGLLLQSLWCYKKLGLTDEYSNRKSLIPLFVKKGSDLNIEYYETWEEKDKTMTFLHFVTLYDMPDIANMLINSNVDINIKNSQKKTALHYAIEKNNVKIAEILLSSKASKSVKDLYGKTPAEYIKDDQVEIKKLFEKY